MSVLEIEQAVSKMTAEELAQFSKWFEEFLADEWDRQIERDAAAGKFDKIIRKVDEDIAAGRSAPMRRITPSPNSGPAIATFQGKFKTSLTSLSSFSKQTARIPR